MIVIVPGVMVRSVVIATSRCRIWIILGLFFSTYKAVFPIKNPRHLAGILDSVLLSRDYRLVTLPAAGPLAPLSMVKDTF